MSACVSFSQMAVSFAHIVKAAEPVLSVALSGPLLGIQYPLYVWASLIPIVAGCSLSAMKEVSFAWSGKSKSVGLGSVGGIKPLERWGQQCRQPPKLRCPGASEARLCHDCDITRHWCGTRVHSREANAWL